MMLVPRPAVLRVFVVGVLKVPLVLPMWMWMMGVAECAVYYAGQFSPLSSTMLAAFRYHDTFNEYATCYISCDTRIPRNAKCPHVGVFGALYRAIGN
eukprot:3096617-Pleurochrysis_carterae.AAC.1